MIAMAERPQSKSAHGPQPEFDFGDHLPAGRSSFTPHFLASFIGGTAQHWVNLIEKGAFGKRAAVDIRAPGSSRVMYRIPREPLVRFLNSRTDLQATADANPAPKPRPHTGGKIKRTLPGGKRS